MIFLIWEILMEMEVISAREQFGVPSGIMGEAPPSVDLNVDEEVDDLPVPAPRIPKAHRAYGKGSKTTRGRGLSDQPRRNVQLRLGY